MYATNGMFIFCFAKREVHPVTWYFFPRYQLRYLKSRYSEFFTAFLFSTSFTKNFVAGPRQINILGKQGRGEVGTAALFAGRSRRNNCSRPSSLAAWGGQDATNEGQTQEWIGGKKVRLVLQQALQSIKKATSFYLHSLSRFCRIFAR